MGDEQNGHKTSRLDRIEGLMELLINDHLKFSDEHKSLLTSQILLTDRMDKLMEAQKHTHERLNVFILAVDDLIRKRPSQ